MATQTCSSGAPQAIFDFDNTLTQFMVFGELARAFGEEPAGYMAQAMSDNWWVNAFGGLDRIRFLNRTLGALVAMDVECFVCSMNADDVISEGLQRVGLLHHFKRLGCDLRIIPNCLSDKGVRVRLNLKMCGGKPETTVFIDDNSRHVANVADVNPGIGKLQCSREGLTEEECEGLIVHFHKIVTSSGGAEEIERQAEPSYQEGQAVQVKRTNGLWQSGRITDIAEDGRVAVDLDDGLQKSIAATKRSSLLRSSQSGYICSSLGDTGSSLPSSNSSPRTAVFQTGQAVEVKRNNGTWQSGEVVAASADGGLIVLLDDGAQVAIPASTRSLLMRPLLRSVHHVGEKVEVMRTNGTWQVGAVSCVAPDGGIIVELDDGAQKSVSLRKQAALVRRLQARRPQP